MNDMQLNLTRKWRSKTFDDLVGQDLSVKLLKNALFRNLFFPVYLFSGQRGCGKTSLARVFSAALNCHGVSSFRTDPKNSILPCLSCTSCNAYIKGNHPDIIEIDAASHTGVDMMREIIESSSFLPVLGIKKVYLIDEAHMLSKAACNALLKILEEPPSSVLFILATTDPEKIIDTVRSRCFQLFFQPADTNVLAQHLAYICKQEQIAYEHDALVFIAQESDGSIRDAINLLERVRFLEASVNQSIVRRVLGHIDDEMLFSIVQSILLGDTPALAKLLQAIDFTMVSPDAFFMQLISLIRAILWVKCSCPLDEKFVSLATLIDTLIPKIDLERLHTVSHELLQAQLFLQKTTTKVSYLFLILTRMCGLRQSVPVAVSEPAPDSVMDVHQKKKVDIATSDAIPVVPASERNLDQWQMVLAEITALDDGMLLSVFSQAVEQQYNPENAQLRIVLPKSLLFFEDTLEQKRDIWTTCIQTVYGKKTTAMLTFATMQPHAAHSHAVHPHAVSSKKNVESTVTVATRSAETSKKKTTHSIVHENRVAATKYAQNNRIQELIEVFPGALLNRGSVHEEN